jgi:hypothetical protein
MAHRKRGASTRVSSVRAAAIHAGHIAATIADGKPETQHHGRRRKTHVSQWSQTAQNCAGEYSLTMVSHQRSIAPKRQRCDSGEDRPRSQGLRRLEASPAAEFADTVIHQQREEQNRAVPHRDPVWYYRPLEVRFRGGTYEVGQTARSVHQSKVPRCQLCMSEDWLHGGEGRSLLMTTHHRLQRVESGRKESLRYVARDAAACCRRRTQ